MNEWMNEWMNDKDGNYVQSYCFHHVNSLFFFINMVKLSDAISIEMKLGIQDDRKVRTNERMIRIRMSRKKKPLSSCCLSNSIN